MVPLLTDYEGQTPLMSAAIRGTTTFAAFLKGTTGFGEPRCDTWRVNTSGTAAVHCGTVHWVEREDVR